MTAVSQSFLQFPVPEFFSGLPPWAQGSIAAVAVAAVLGLVIRLVRYRLRRIAEATTNTADDLLADVADRTTAWFPMIVGLWVGTLFLELPDKAGMAMRFVLAVALGIQAGRWLATLVEGMAMRAASERDPKSATMTIVRITVRTVVWAGVFLMVLANLGVDVTALVAGLGVGGVAVALALQAVLGDLFASLAIAFDKPFEVGDFIVLDDAAGTVERVGLKTTRVRSISGEQLVFSNAKMLESRIRNFRRMEERRIVFEFGVTYQTPFETLRAIPGEVEKLVRDDEQTRFDRAHFKSYGDSALIFEVVYYVLSRDYTDYMNAQQRINLALFERMAEMGAGFAYPTQTLFVVNEPAAEENESATEEAD